MDNEMMEKLALLNAIRSSREDDELGNDFYISSLRDANILLQKHMTPEGANYRKQLVDYITTPANRVLAEGDVYHNFVMDLFRTGDYVLGLKVCNFALEQAPYHRDLLGDAIKACGDSSQFDLGEMYIARAMKLPFSLWSYRLFLYSVDFLKTKLSANPCDEELFNRAYSMVMKFIEFFPFDEHGYNQKAELFILKNDRGQAIDDLYDSIFRIHPDTSDDNSRLVTAQCCVTLLNILDDSNDYDLIIRVCDKGLLNTTQEQPSARIGFFTYRKALALDAKAHTQDFQTPTTIELALKVYQSAYDLNQDRSYQKTIEQRYAVLRPYAQNFHPLVKRELYIEERDSTDSFGD